MCKCMRDGGLINTLFSFMTISPGISAYASNPPEVAGSLGILVEFAKEVLKGKEHQFHNFPIFLKATGNTCVKEFPNVIKIRSTISLDFYGFFTR